MFLILIAIVFGAVEARVILQPNVGLRWSYPRVPSSYISTAPVISNYEVIEQVPEKSVSYSISYKDYLYLQKHKVEGKDSPFNPDPVRDSLVPTYEHVHNYHHDEHKSQSVGSKLKPTRAVQPAEVLKRSTGPNVVFDHSLPIVNVPVEPIVNVPVAPIVNVPVQPIVNVNKHVYFHVPPPDFEENSNVPVVLSPPQKKHYNIIFIKAPSQEPNYAQLQQILQSRAPTEEKTLIYVLSQKQESPVPVVFTPVPKPVSAPEVYYVKYKVSPKDGTKINSELSETSLLQNISPILEQRLEDRDC